MTTKTCLVCLGYRVIRVAILDHPRLVGIPWNQELWLGGEGITLQNVTNTPRCKNQVCPECNGEGIVTDEGSGGT